MMKLVYQCGNELVSFNINRKNKYLEIASSKTKYEFIPQPWSMLFDKGKEAQQDKETKDLSDQEFKKRITESMCKVGYYRCW